MCNELPIKFEFHASLKYHGISFCHSSHAVIANRCHQETSNGGHQKKFSWRSDARAEISVFSMQRTNRWNAMYYLDQVSHQRPRPHRIKTARSPHSTCLLPSRSHHQTTDNAGGNRNAAHDGHTHHSLLGNLVVNQAFQARSL
jgi:hypothetical protein